MTQMHCGHCYDNHQSPYSGECPGVICQECADNREWHRAIMAETCGEDEVHCPCVPTLRKEIARLTKYIAVQEEARKSVEEFSHAKSDEIARLIAENTRLDAEWKQAHKWNNELVAEHYRLTAATRKVVEALRCHRTGHPCGTDTTIAGRQCQCLACSLTADPVLVALGGE